MMSVVAEQRRGVLQPGGRRSRAAAISVADQVDRYRRLHEEASASAIAAQAEVTSLKVQLDCALMELASRDSSIKLLTGQCNMLRSLVAAKDEKLQNFQKKLGSIKAAMTKQMDKRRSGDKDLQLTLDCILQCCRELCTHAISPEEFHLAVNLILSTLTSHPPTFITHTSSQGAEFDEEGRRHLSSLPLEERRLRLAEITSSSTTEMDSSGDTSSTDGSPVVQLRDTRDSEEGGLDGGSATVLAEEVEEGCEEGEEEEKREEGDGEGGCGRREQGVSLEPARKMCGEGEYVTLSNVAVPLRRHGERRESEKKRSVKMTRYVSANALLQRGVVTEPESDDVIMREGHTRRELHVLRKTLGVREGSIFTGSLPNLDQLARWEEEEEGEDEEEYIDPWELASTIVPLKHCRRISERLSRQMKASQTYLKILSPAHHPGMALPLNTPSQRRSLGERRKGGSREDDACSLDWEEGEDEGSHYATIPASSPRDVRERRLGKELSLSEGERIYEVIDDITFPASSRRVSRKLSRRPRVTSMSRRRQFSKMKGVDGYEVLDVLATDAAAGGIPIPRWPERTPSLPPPRKSSAPALRTYGVQDHVHGAVQLTLSVPVDAPSAPYSPAVSSDENQSDGETIPELFYTTSSFVTMDSRPHPPDGTDKTEKEAGTKPLKRRQLTVCTRIPSKVVEEEAAVRTKSHTLPPSPSAAPHADNRPEHCGYLTKFDSRLRPGKRRYFVLAGSELKYYRNKESSFGRPRKTINLNSWCKLAIVDNVIFKLMTSSHTYHLSGGSEAETEGWVHALQDVLRRPSELPSPSRSPVSPSRSPVSPSASPSLTGWAHMTESGAVKKVWCHLEHGTLFISPQQQTEPLRCVDMAACSVRKVRDSLLMDSRDSTTCLSSQLVIQEEGQPSPWVLVPCNLEDKEMWFVQLSLASRCGRDDMLELTPTEQYLATLIREGGALDHPLWKHPVLNVTDSPLRSSLTTLPSTSLYNKAFKLFQNVQMFMYTPLSRLALECHMTAAQHIISTCQRHSQLQDELYCQLLRQLTGTADQNNRSLQQGWCLLSLVIPMFLPVHPRITWYLTAVLQHTLAGSQPILTGFAQHCLDAVERVRGAEPRRWRPSSQELQGLLSHFALNPTSLKISLYLLVQLPDGTTEDLEYNASSTVSELLTQLNVKLGMPPCEESGFSLMSDWPGVEECAFFLLPEASKLGDLLACWWHAMEELCPSGSGVRHRAISLAYRNRLSVQSRRGQETEREAELLAYQISQEVASGRHRVTSQREGIKMAAIMAQLEYGDWEKVGGGEGGKGEEGEEEEEGKAKRTAIAREALLKFGPMKFTQMSLEHDLSLSQRVLVEQWTLCAGTSRAKCAQDFLGLARQWHLCGATLFLAEMCSGMSVWLAVNEDGISLLSPSSMDTRQVYSYDQLTAFGEDGDHLVLVTSSQPGSHSNTETEKVLLVMSKAKIHQATNLMTSYLEVRTNT